MDENPKAQEPGKKEALRQDHQASPSKAADAVARVLGEAAQAEAEGLYAHASLLALHALQLDPASSEASAIFERCQVALRRKENEIEPLGSPLRHVTPVGAEGRLLDNLPRHDALRHPLNLNAVSPLMPAATQRGLGARIWRAILPFAVLGLFVAGLWLSSRPTGTFRPPTPAPPAVAEPDLGSPPESGSRPAALVPGTASLNIVPWAKVDAIYSVNNGHEIEPEGLVSPCTISLPPGKYGFTVSHPDYGSIELPVVVKSGEVTKVEHSLISSQDLEKELAPLLGSIGLPPRPASAGRVREHAELRR